MGSGKLHGEHSYTGCTVTIKSVKIARLYLNRLRVWDAAGTPLVAMRVWSETPFQPKMLMQMQPTVAPGANISLPDILSVLEGEGKEEETHAEPA